MIELALLLAAVALCLGVVAVLAGGPAPVVVIGERGECGYLTIEVLAPQGRAVRAGQVTVVGRDSRCGLDLGPGTHRLTLAGVGPHQVSWTVSASGGGTTEGSMLVA
ncbi:hypothetical protein [Nocardioides flavescens]|uniref:Uncharacterized protein n=1 Tax=Nocardioides flavescens TaxID=2691959 RepID=A0A6L7F4F3_9ACTN|nr:hypothetical protein [Nocardioides flavescens]MXG92095.1 hypothetical protein [Nocardioides flavescens]